MKTLLTGLFMLVASFALAAEETVRVIGSVAEIELPSPTRSPQPPGFVEIHLRLHSPAEVSGTTLVMVTATRDRGSVRARMPLGSLYEAKLPTALFATLKQQRTHQEQIEKTVDQGVPREMISDAVFLTSIPLSDLPAPLVPFPPKP